MSVRYDYTGKRFGRLLAIQYLPGKRGKGRWLCLCDCGNKTTPRTPNLTFGRANSCGCLRSSQQGQSRSPSHVLWRNAKFRANRAGVPFDILPLDIVIPSHCPIFGTPLTSPSGKRGGSPSSPSLDRIIPTAGYVRGNIEVISRRANMIKNDATAAELERVAKHIRDRETLNG